MKPRIIFCLFKTSTSLLKNKVAQKTQHPLLRKRMKINFIDLKAQYSEYQKEINNEVLEVFSSAQFIGGEKLNSLEKNLATYTGAKFAIGCSSGTDALLLSLMALDIGAGDEVITTPFTFIATAEVIAFLGAKPVFVDIDEDSYNIDPSKIENVITDSTKAIMPVSLYGQCADMDTINEIAKKHDIPVIEDACQSFGATYHVTFQLLDVQVSFHLNLSVPMVMVELSLRMMKRLQQKLECFSITVKMRDTDINT